MHGKEELPEEPPEVHLFEDGSQKHHPRLIRRARYYIIVKQNSKEKNDEKITEKNC